MSSEGKRWRITKIVKDEPIQRIVGPEIYMLEVVPASEVERLEQELRQATLVEASLKETLRDIERIGSRVPMGEISAVASMTFKARAALADDEKVSES